MCVCERACVRVVSVTRILNAWCWQFDEGDDLIFGFYVAAVAMKCFVMCLDDDDDEHNSVLAMIMFWWVDKNDMVEKYEYIVYALYICMYKCRKNWVQGSLDRKLNGESYNRDFK